jgi:predicted nucleic acid-binding Zn finger protein
MEQNLEIYERIIDKIIKIHKDSLSEILLVIKSLNLFEDDFLLQIITYLKIGKLYEITCEEIPGFKYYILNIGEIQFFFHDDNYCNCDMKLDDKIKYKNICKHLLTFKILLGTNAYNKITFNKEQMMRLINETQF